MSEAVRKTGNPVLIDKYAQKTALRLGVTPEATRKEFSKAKTDPIAAAPDDEYFDSAAAETEEAIPRPNAPELQLLKLVLRHDDGLGWLVAHLDADWIQHPLVKDITARRMKAHRDGTWRNIGAFLADYESSQTRSLITECISDKHALPNPDQQLADITLRLRNQFVDQQMAALMHRLSQPEIGDAERAELLKHQQEWKTYKRQPLAPLA